MLINGLRFKGVSEGEATYRVIRPNINRPGDWWCEAVDPHLRRGAWSYHEQYIIDNRLPIKRYDHKSVTVVYVEGVPAGYAIGRRMDSGEYTNRVYTSARAGRRIAAVLENIKPTIESTASTIGAAIYNNL